MFLLNTNNIKKSIIIKIQSSMKLFAQMAPHRANTVSVHPKYKNFFSSSHPIALINNVYIYTVQFNETISEEKIQLSQLTKRTIFGDEDCSYVSVASFEAKISQNRIKEMTIYISHEKRPPNKLSFNSSELEAEIRKKMPILNHDDHFYFSFKEIDMWMRNDLGNKQFGFIVEDTIFDFKIQPHQRIEIIEDAIQIDTLFQNFESKVKNLKVGGMKDQLELIQRRVFCTRMLHPKMMRKLNLKHIKGMLLYGPPGTGKTLIAREISKILKVEPKIVNGPEILNELVGKSQQKIRDLFEDARRQQNEKGAKSELHCIIFDEIDAICKKRGTQTSSAVYDLIVNQLLTCIDGINALNNILVIGITNRKDLIDDAVLRPGRLEVHIEVNIPDEKGRSEVLNIHTEQMKKNNCLEANVNLNEIAKRTKNYTGAELEGVVKSAQSFALQNWKKYPDAASKDRWKVTQADFQKGISQVSPQFGRDNKLLDAIIPKTKRIISKYEDIKEKMKMAIDKFGCGKHTFLIRGNPGVGKTVMAAEIALSNQYPFTKLINCDRFLGLSEDQVINEIVKIFEDADKCNVSFIILDDILRLINFIPLGPRFSSQILNLLINFIKKVLDPSKKQIIIATVSTCSHFEELGMLKYFKYVFNISPLEQKEARMLLTQLGFGLKQASLMSKEISKSTLHEIISTTDIEGNRNAEAWIRSWKQSRFDDTSILCPEV